MRIIKNGINNVSILSNEKNAGSLGLLLNMSHIVSELPYIIFKIVDFLDGLSSEEFFDVNIHHIISQLVTDRSFFISIRMSDQTWINTFASKMRIFLKKRSRDGTMRIDVTVTKCDRRDHGHKMRQFSWNIHIGVFILKKDILNSIQF